MFPKEHDPANQHHSKTQIWEFIARSDEVGEGQAIERTVRRQLIALFRSAGVLYAIEGLCAHHGGPLSQGAVADGCVTCPWHGWQYRLADGTHATSGEPLIAAFPLREREGIIEVLLDA